MFERSPPPPPPGASSHAAPATPAGRRHTVSAFDEDLTGIVALTLRLGGQAEELTDLALRAMETGDPALAEDAAARRARLTGFARSATASAAFVLALRQPMAADLRLVLSEHRPDQVRWMVDRITLFESRLSSRGSSYHVVESAMLGPSLDVGRELA